MERYLVLKNGSVYKGHAFGSKKAVNGEVVFSTGMTGYQETITDPSYYGQIMVFTNPLIGNYGITTGDDESLHPQVKAIIAHEIAKYPSNYRCKMTLTRYAEKQDLPGISGIDTRRLTKEIRDQGSMPGVITDDLNHENVNQLFDQKTPNKLSDMTTIENSYPAPNDGPKIAIIDYGIKNSIMKQLSKRHANMVVFQSNVSAKTVLDSYPDAVMLSNGPGDPEKMSDVLPTIQTLEHQLPLMGICFGNQLLALANGAKTYKMKFGHRGFNHAVKDLTTGKCYFTSQNHGYAVDRNSLKGTNLETWFEEINDHTVEGIKVKDCNAFSVQFHPDASPGPHDALYVFDQFFEMIKQSQKK
ncbi:carbamoyl-phosphate synthase small chain [Philodulcilactobacillus myokoensis]|uniref:Carbamoyl phosphate synthase small chain n=2 Tax=Philodulcilactobacillus myokoensis TaxID=2929573 RepID=A0A9W6B218_9LACO|nr:carbamoyl-phosphate synthase small chain [Philodulcilactobacillus myokoensis]